MDGMSLQTVLLDCHPRNPLRPLDWRWRLSAGLAGAREPARRRWVDGWVRRAARFRRAAGRAGDPGHRRPLRLDPDLAAAHALRFGADPGRRLAAEAGLLAGEGYHAAAARCGLGPAAAEAYGRLFYDVAEALGAADYLVAVAMSDLHDRPGVETLVKTFAYLGGPHVLDAVLHALGLRAAPPGSEPTAEDIKSVHLAFDLKRLAAEPAKAAMMIRLAALADEVDLRGDHGGHSAVSRPLALRVELALTAPAAGDVAASTPRPPASGEPGPGGQRVVVRVRSA